jgi:hypothetical protein
MIANQELIIIQILYFKAFSKLIIVLCLKRKDDVLNNLRLMVDVCQVGIFSLILQF